MKASEAIEQLKKIVEEKGDADLVFDTEARCFDVHLVSIKSISHVPDELSGVGDIVCLSFDFANEPHHANRDECLNCAGQGLKYSSSGKRFDETYVFNGKEYRKPTHEECHNCHSRYDGDGSLCEPCTKFPI